MNIIESQLRQIFAGIVWTHKIQEKQSDIYLNRYNFMEFIRIIISALTTSGVCAVIFVDQYILKIITAIISFLGLGISIYYKSYDLGSLQKKHKKSALELLELREEIITVLCDIKMEKYNEESLIIKRDEIIKKQFEIYKECLDATPQAVKMASENLKIRRDNTYSDEEIDSFLPILARKNK